MTQYLEDRKRPCEERSDIITDGEQEVRMKRETGRKKHQVTWEENLIGNTEWIIKPSERSNNKLRKIIFWGNQKLSSGFKGLQYNKYGIL